jgi:hypothetical protein
MRFKKEIRFVLSMLVITLISLLLAKVQGQDKLSLGLYQDAKLAFIGDDIGNDAFTLDAKFDVSMQGKQFKDYYFEIRSQIEYADLKDNFYLSVLVNPNWVYNSIDRFELSAGAIAGLIYREKAGEDEQFMSFISFGLSGDISFLLTDDIKISYLGQYIYRGEFDMNKMVYNGYIGIKYNLN